MPPRPLVSPVHRLVEPGSTLRLLHDRSLHRPQPELPPQMESHSSLFTLHFCLNSGITSPANRRIVSWSLGAVGMIMKWVTPTSISREIRSLISPAVPISNPGPISSGGLPNLSATRLMVSSLSAADPANRVAPAHEISIS